MSGRKTEPEPEAADRLPASAHGADGLTQLVVFRVGPQRYALPIGAVQEIQQIVAVSELPGTGEGVIGAIDLRGRVVPVLDARALLGAEPRAYDLQTPMLFARTVEGLVALMVDEVDDVVDAPVGGLQPAPSGHVLSGRLLGVCLVDGVVFVLDVDRLVPEDAVAAGCVE